MKKGSTLAFSLLYIALLLILIVGISYLISRAFRTQEYITQGVQASYNAESSMELALYTLKLHREGYESAGYFPTKGIGFGAKDNGALDFQIAYTNTPQVAEELPLTHSDRQLALFHERDGIQNNGELSLTYSTKNLPSDIENSTACIEFKLSGKLGDAYETISTSLPCGTEERSIENYLFSDSSKNNKGKVTHAKDFLKTHTEVYLIARLIPNTTLSETQKPVLRIKTSSKISSYMKKVTAVGRYNSLEIRKQLLMPQDQSPDILSMALWHK